MPFYKPRSTRFSKSSSDDVIREGFFFSAGRAPSLPAASSSRQQQKGVTQSPREEASSRPREELRRVKTRLLFRRSRRTKAARMKDNDSEAVRNLRASIVDLGHCLSIDNASQPDLDLLENLDIPLTHRGPVVATTVGGLVPEGRPGDFDPKHDRIRAFLHEAPLEISKFQIKTILGSGAYGLVYLATYGQKKKVRTREGEVLQLPPFAIKCVSKRRVIDLGKVRQVFDEEEVPFGLNHPNINALYATFQDGEHLYFVSEFVQGGELYQRIEKLRSDGVNCLPLHHSRFYFAEVYAALYYLHQKNIAYRDLKPENVMICRNGHVKLIDFGFAKTLNQVSVQASRLRLGRKKSTLQRSATLVGTPDYLAPEFLVNAPLTGEGGTPNPQKHGHKHGMEVDIWGLGILLYEMLTGVSPYWDEAGDFKIYHNILTKPVTFHKHFEPEAKDIIKRLLKKKPDQRLGCGKQPAIHQHAFIKTHFKSDDIFQGNLAAPWIPELESPLDVSCFHIYSPAVENREYVTPQENEEFVRFGTTW